ncbi:MAG: potassium transporter Kup [Acidimicrobiales bacterium]
MSDHRTSGRAVLTVGALGVVYGDIGTSPLYAMRESFDGAGHEVAVIESNVLGILSLIFWSLIIVITIKYLLFVMRADNHGEGGILALTALLPGRGDRSNHKTVVLVLIGLFGTALLYGDGMITPAISVLSAVEGTEVATDSFSRWVEPLAVVILIGIFAVQRFGTGAVGRVFGPVMALWFATLGTLGAVEIGRHPTVVRALNPIYAVDFFGDEGLTGLLVLGSVFLVVTGGEALYADMGHFGRSPIAIGWFAIVLPGLLLNYFGQGALLLDQPGAISNPFYELAPEWGVVPLVVLATFATVIASQALISGAFSLTMQAVQLGYFPRVKIIHTSAREYGQVYVPAVNWALMVACVGLVVGFRSSTGLAAAYGVAVTITMIITTVLFYVVARRRLGWSLARVALPCAVFIVVDAVFFAANVPKIPHGGWFPLAVAAVLIAVFTTWNTGRRIIRERVGRPELDLVHLVESLQADPPRRVDGAAVYLYREVGGTPPALLADLRHHGVLHERVLVVAVVTDDIPRVHPVRRVSHADLGLGFETVELHFGFMETPDVPRALAERLGLDAQSATYLLGRETVLVTDRPGMAPWREHLFAFMHRNATNAAEHFALPLGRSVEVGSRVEL